jgi:hypothetical protein
MGLPSASPPESDPPSPLSNLRRAAARCWALLLVRIYECLPLRCPKCGEPMRIIAFVLDEPTIERILAHIGEPTQPPAVLPARSPPQLKFGFDQTIATADWPEMDQTAGATGGRLGVIPYQANQRGPQPRQCGEWGRAPASTPDRRRAGWKRCPGGGLGQVD